MHKPPQRNLDEILDAYRDYLLSKVSKVHILGEANERELRNVFVDLSIVDQRATPQHAEILSLMNSAKRRRFNPFARVGSNSSPEISGQRENGPTRLKPDKLLQQGTRAIVTGGPGCGKTTLLKYLALRTQEKPTHLVIWLELKAIDSTIFVQAEKAAARGGNLILQELWVKHLKTQMPLSEEEIQLLRKHWREKFKANEVTIFLDGFDELQNDLMERSLNKCVREFVSGSHSNTVLISTRPYAQHRLGSERLQELEIEPLNQSQIEAFLNCYYPNDKATKILLNTLRERSALRELLHIPLLLGVILRLHRENMFTDEQLKLYETIIINLVHELDRSKSIIRQFKINDKRLRVDFLEFLAFERLLRDPIDDEAHEAHRIVFNYELLKEKARKFLTEESLPYNARDLANDVLATPLVREIGPDMFAFTHLALQEYLAARALTTLHKNNEFEGLKIFCRAYHNPTIAEMEVLPMMLGGTSNADKLYGEIECWPESLTFANLRLRARGLTYSAKINSERLSKMIDRLVEFISGEHLDEQPYHDIITYSFAGVNLQTVHSIEAKIEPLLNSTDSNKFFGAASALGKLGSDKAVDAYVTAFDPEYSYVSYGAAYALGGIGTDKAVDALIHALDNYPHLRAIAAEKLGEIGSEKAVGSLIAALNDEDDEVRENAAYALEKIGSLKAVDALITALSDKASRVRSSAAYALSTISSDKATNALIVALDDEDEYVCSHAIEALGKLGTDEAIDGLISAMNHKSESIRSKVAEELGRIGSEEAVNPLINAMNIEKGYARWSIAAALGQIGSEKAVDLLLSDLNDADRSVRWCAALALARVDSDKVAAAITPVWNEIDLTFQSDMTNVGDGTSKKTVAALASDLNHKNKDIRLKAVDALGDENSDESVNALISALKDKDKDVRFKAIGALDKIGSDKAVDPLISTLKDKEDNVRWNTARALGQLSSDKAVVALLPILKDKNWQVRSSAAEALAQIKVENLISGLTYATKQQDSFTRKKAIAVIGYYSDDIRTLEHLRELVLKDRDKDVRDAAKEAAEKFAHKLTILSNLTSKSATPPLHSNTSKEGVLVHEIGLIVSSVGHFFREVLKYDEGIDGEIEFSNEFGRGSGQRIYLQLKSGDSYLERQKSGKEFFRIKKQRHAEYWKAQAYPVLLVIRNSDGLIRWMDVTEYLRRHGANVSRIEFQGEPFTPESVKQMRDRYAR